MFLRAPRRRPGPPGGAGREGLPSFTLLQFLKMVLPRVYPILDSAALAAREIPLLTAASAMIEGGARIMQFRHKGHWNRALFEGARGVARLCREAGVGFIVNDRCDFALLLEAGLHVGQDDLPPGMRADC